MEQLNQRNTEDEGEKTDLGNTVDFRIRVTLCQQLNAINFESEGMEKKNNKRSRPKTELI